MNMKVIAVDDEPLALKLLEDNISKVSFLEPVAFCSNAFEAIKALQQHKVDLIFLDVQMPGLSGLEFIATLDNKPIVILITAYKQYALESYNLAVADYLVKPVALERFILACNRAHELYELRQLKTSQVATPSPEYFFVNADYSQVKIVFSDITWMEGLRDYVKIHLKSSNKPVITRSTLKAIDDQLPAGKFIRFHKSYIVAIESIKAVRKNSIFIGNDELPIGETYREEVEALINKNS